MKYVTLLGRLLFAYIFIQSSFGHFTQKSIDYAAKSGVPLASLAVPVSGVLCLLGGLMVLLGFKAKWGAWMLVLFLVPVTLTMHNFWAVTDPAKAQMQEINFFKNLSMLGGALIIAAMGAGQASLDELLKRRRQRIAGATGAASGQG